MKPRECVLTFSEPGLGREVQAGKIVRVIVHGGRRWCYVNNVSLAWDLMEELDAWGVAPCVILLMGEMGVNLIHYVCREEGVTYATDPETVKAKGVLASYGGRGQHYHLPRRYWHREDGKLEYPWTNKRVKLEWEEAA